MGMETVETFELPMEQILITYLRRLKEEKV